MLDAALMGLDNLALADRVAAFAPDMTVITTAPTYLFWRCAPPELRTPRALLNALAGRGGLTVAVGPHGSATPEPTLRKLGCDLVVRGECEEVVAALAQAPDPRTVASVAYLDGERAVVNGAPAAARFIDLPPLRWPAQWTQRHRHHHHRYGTEAAGPGAEVEASRGCPYHCSFCAKIDFRDQYRRRALEPLLAEIDGLIDQGATYLYFIDEIFLPNRPLLEALARRPVQFGVQTRIDLWKPEMLDLLGAAGCVSIEAGVESLTEDGRAMLDKRCRMTTEDLADRLIHARKSVPFVQANLLQMAGDEAALVAAWRDGPTIRCPSILIPPRPTTGGCSARPTSWPGSGPTPTIWSSSRGSATSRMSSPCRWRSWRPPVADERARPGADDGGRGRRGVDLCPGSGSGPDRDRLSRHSGGDGS
jgi:B12-binding domain/radical SAM domain protein of rhizo-twelve system